MTKNKEGGAWLAIAKSGKIGMLTNFRCRTDMNAGTFDPSFTSRGHLLVNYLHSNTKPSSYIDQVLNGQKKYSPFNLIVGNYSTDVGFNFSYGSNALGFANKDYEIQPGILLYIHISYINIYCCVFVVYEY